MLYHNLIDAIGNTPLVEMPRMSPKPAVKLYAKLEGQNPSGSVKDRIAKYMIEEAERTGVLTKDRIVLEPTSGNTGISLAMICRIKGYRLKVVIPESVSAERTELLTAFGAEIVYSDGVRGTNGSIEVANQIAAEDPAYFMPYQYGNEMNPRAHYETTGPEILRDLPEIDVFVAGMGTGGTLTGTARYLKEHKPGVKVVAAVPHPGDLVQGLRSLEEVHPAGAGRVHPRRQDRRRFAHVVRVVEGADAARGHLRRDFGRRGREDGAARGRAAGCGQHRLPVRRRRLEVPEHAALDDGLRGPARGHRRQDLVVGGYPRVRRFGRAAMGYPPSTIPCARDGHRRAGAHTEEMSSEPR